MAEKKAKTYRLSEQVLQKIEDRDRTLYQHETQYVEAAVLAFEGGKEDRVKEELLEQRIEKLEQEVFGKMEENPKWKGFPTLPEVDA